MRIANKGDWVQIHQIVLKPEERAPQVPNDTKMVPLELWVKGTLQSDAHLGDTVDIVTLTGRKVSGELTTINPGYAHGYGAFIPELHAISSRLKDILYGGGK